MAKAKDDHTLPLDDPRWLLLKAAIDERTQHTGDLGLAILDLKRDMASDRLRSMRRNRDTGEARLESVSFWETYSVGYIGSSSVTICRQSDLDRHELDE